MGFKKTTRVKFVWTQGTDNGLVLEERAERAGIRDVKSSRPKWP